MIGLFLSHWRGYSFAAWNARCDERGYDHAKLSPLAFRRRLRLSAKFAVMDWRERWALRLAPWLREELDR